MNKFKMSGKVMLLTAVLSVLSAALIWTWLVTPARGQSKSQESQSDLASMDSAIPGLGSINRGFRAVKETANREKQAQTTSESSTTTNMAAARALADVLMQDFGLDDLPREITDKAKERLVAAEVDYRAGGSGAVAETRVVRLINDLATTWGAPPYARTNQRELHRFRVQLVPLMPDLASRDSSKSLIASDMSPLEATYITLLLIEQKTINPSYQLTQQEKKERKATQEKPEKIKSSEPKSFISEQSERQKEMARLMVDVEKHIENLSPSNTAAIVGQALDTLGIAKTKEGQR